MSIARQRNIGAWLRPFKGVFQDAANGLITGDAVDRNGDLSCSVITQIGDAVGAPTSYIVTAEVEHSIDGSTNWVTLKSGTALVTNGDIGQLDVDLSSAFKFIRIIVEPVFIGGTAPTINIASIGVLSGSAEYPN